MKRRDLLDLLCVLPIFIALPFRYAWANVQVIMQGELRPPLRPISNRVRPVGARWIHEEGGTGDVVCRIVRSNPGADRFDVTDDAVFEAVMEDTQVPRVREPRWTQWLSPFELQYRNEPGSPLAPPPPDAPEADWERW